MSNEKEICDKWLLNKNINPETSRKIKETGQVYKKLAKKCLSDNIIDRINYYVIMKTYLMTIKEKNNCFGLYNIDEKTKEIKYRIGKKIILDKNIGNHNNNGIVYLSYFKSNIKNGPKFAVKITNQSNKNKKELQVLLDLTKEVINFKCPHFPICYGYMECNNTDDNLIIKDKKLNKNKKLFIQINELASGDLNNNILSNENKDLLNTITQLFISIMFFHNITNSLHSDIHEGNFLFHKINKGGYFHYNIYDIDYYLENKGFLWIIWDFSYISPFTKKNKYGKIQETNINYDYLSLCNIFNNYNNINATDYLIIKKLYNQIISKYNNLTDSSILKNIDKQILEFLLLNVSSFTTIKPSNIINKKPFIII